MKRKKEEGGKKRGREKEGSYGKIFDFIKNCVSFLSL
jgi:hypothetical protein